MAAGGRSSSSGGRRDTRTHRDTRGGTAPFGP
jgi:hypothetical protein